jgi:Flp pilus assembly protein TadD
VRIGAARIYAGTGRAALAIDELRRAMSLQPANDEAHRLLGEILSDSGEMDAAAEAVKKAVALRPNYWYNHSTLGRIYLLAGRHDDAIAAYRRVTVLQPESARGFENLGTAYHAKGDTRTALRHYIRATELGGTSGTYSNIGTLHYEAGRYSEAAAAYAKAIEMHPNEPRLYRNLGDAYSRIGRTSDARTAYTRAIVLAQRLLAVNPNDPATLGMLAVYEATMGRWTDAEGHIGMALASSPRDAQLLYRKAVIFALKGDRANALAALEQSVSRGYSRSQARADDDFARFRDDPQFRRITSSGP